MMKRLAVIPARGGSKRIPRKNIRDFLGKPIIAYSIEAALKCNKFDTIMVSTDNDEIATIAREYGAEIPFLRGQETAGDYSTTDDVLLEVLEEYRKIGSKFDIVACIYPTAPLINAKDLSYAIEKMEKYRPSLVMPLVKFSYPPQRSYIVSKNGYASFLNSEFIQSRSQDLDPMFHEVGQYYVYDVEKFCKSNGMIKNDIMAVIIDESKVQDIDTEEDWKLAELKYRLISQDEQ